MIKFNNQYYQFKPSLLGWVITLICIPLFIKFGLWQYGKAEMKMEMQATYQASVNNAAAPFPVDIITLDEKTKDQWEYKRVAVVGEYETEFQFLLDNKVEATRPGYHVITPLKINDTDQYVLINRGWIPANDLHTDVPVVETPQGVVKIQGQVWVPSTKIFTLEDKESLESQVFQTVRQHVDLQRYKKIVPITVSALMIKLDPKSEAGGFVRSWQVPVDRIATHMGYAYQWYGFAIATLLIFIYISMVRVEQK